MCEEKYVPPTRPLARQREIQRQSHLEAEARQYIMPEETQQQHAERDQPDTRQSCITLSFLKVLACSPYTVTITVSVWASNGSQNMVCAKIILLILLTGALAAGGMHRVNILISA